MGSVEYVKTPLLVTFRSQDKLITVHGDKVRINALKDETEARKIFKRLKRDINDAWDQHESIATSYKGQPRPSVMEPLKLLPKTICRECGETTCMVFAVRMAGVVKGIEDCSIETRMAQRMEPA